MRLIYHPDAEAELVEAARFYEKRMATLGARFLDAVDEAIKMMQAAPDRPGVLTSGVRRYLLPRFPYAIYYRVLVDEIRILAFKHHSRHPITGATD